MNRSSLRYLASFGGDVGADSYTFQPTTVAEIREIVVLARREGKRIVMRGAGRSYGDASILAEEIALDLTRFRSIISFDNKSGILHAQGGATIEMLWKRSLPDGWWPPVVSGTMYVTVAGAIAMNIHGKNQFTAGDFGEHVLEIEMMDARGQVRTITPEDQDFWWVVGGAGTLGIILSAKIQLRRVPGGTLDVRPVRCRNWDDQFRCFDQFERVADYMVSWVDAFGEGRGLFHAANYRDDANASFGLEFQEMDSKVLKILPKDQLWRVMKLFTNRPGMRLVNAAKYHASRGPFASTVSDANTVRSHAQTLAEFSFLLDSAPNWQRAYAPATMIQTQSFVPKDAARSVFEKQIRDLSENRMEPMLAVMKRHQPDRAKLSHSVNGYSLALDFRMIERSHQAQIEILSKLHDDVLDAGGRFYLAKDRILSAQQFARSVGAEAIAEWAAVRKRWDPDGVFGGAIVDRITGFLRQSKPDAESLG